MSVPFLLQSEPPLKRSARTVSSIPVPAPAELSALTAEFVLAAAGTLSTDAGLLRPVSTDRLAAVFRTAAGIPSWPSL